MMGSAAFGSEPTTLQDKLRVLAARQAAFRSETQRAQLGEALSRARLGEALITVLADRARLTQIARDALWDSYLSRVSALARPDRRNRVRRLVERLLVRGGTPGRALILARSGVWRSAASNGSARSAIESYVRAGADPAAQPAALFDQSGYLASNPTLAGSRLSPLLHHLVYGSSEGPSPHPLFDAAYYKSAALGDLEATGLSPLAHYIRVGAGRGFSPHPLFDPRHYVAQAPDLVGSDETPLEHYLRVGSDRDLSPHLLFQPAYYRAQLPLEARDQNLLLHYLRQGSGEGLKPHPLFDPIWYREHYDDLGAQEPLAHFVAIGGGQLRNPGPWFDSVVYAQTAGEARAKNLDPLSDYLAGGAWKVGELAAGLHLSAYLVAHPELALSGLTPLEHWALAAG